MEFSILNIVLIIISALLLIAVVWLIITQRQRILNKERKIERQYRQEISLYESELTRLEYIYQELQQQNNSIKKSTDNQSISPDTTEKLLVEQKKIEHEKELLTERNKKLWEMSLAIEKDKTHIAMLKNQIESKHRDVTDSIQYAKRIQDALLPSLTVLDNLLAGYFLMWKPRDIVSGDFYWIRQQGQLLIFTIADCTGHGVPGAFMSMLGITYLNEATYQISKQTKPSDILEQLRSKVIISLKQRSAGFLDPKDGMDMALCILDTKTLELQFSGANNPMYLISNSKLTELKPVRNPIGLYPKEKPFETQTIQLTHGDWIYLFSDGFPDQIGAETQKKLSYARFKNILLDINQKTSNPEEQKNLLEVSFEDWRLDFIQMDDVLVGGFKI